MVTKTGIIGLGLLSLSSLALASPAADTAAQRGVQSEIRLSASRLNGVSGEFVYDAFGADSGIPGYKLSELQWQLESVYLVGLGASITPNEWLRLNVDYWTAPSDGNGTMDDYDWLYVGLDWSHWSHHDDTTVTEVGSLDLNGEFTLYDFGKKKTVITGLLGFKHDTLAWQSVGGYGIYSSTGGYRDLFVTFPNTPGISYEQTFYMPYIGVGVRATTNNGSMPIVLSASFRYSNQVHGEGVDIHHLRDLRFEDSGDGGKWQAYDINIDFHLSKTLALNLGYAAQRYAEVKATTTMTDLASGDKFFFPGDAAGLDNRSNLLKMGLSYRF
ncbi:MAG TPA: omptin family outer membrane protease, partial [Gammaproteobacteria bacterium]